MKRLLLVRTAAIFGACIGLFASAARAGGDAAAQPQDAATTLIAFVAANATDPFNDLIAVFEHEHPGVRVVPEYAGTQILETQAEQGAPFDVFVSADRAHVDALARERLVTGIAPLSEGHEVIVVPKDDPAGILSLRDLAEKPAKLVLAAGNVPIGTYTRQVLARAALDYGRGFPDRVLAQAVSFESNVKQVLEKVALDEADAGIVYFTDVTPAYASKVTIVPIPQKYEVEAANYIAAAAQSRRPDLARELVALAVGPAGQAIFRRHGYDPLR